MEEALFGSVTVLLFLLPVAARRWIWLWPLIALVVVASIVHGYLVFIEYWPDRHGFLRMWVILLAWPLVIGLVVRGIVAVAETAAKRRLTALFWTISVLGFVTACVPSLALLSA